VGGKWETKCDARIGVNVRQAVLAGLYVIPLKFLLQSCRLKISAFFIHSLHFPFLYDGDYRFESCPVLEAPLNPTSSK
jgi:hypothetical protein